MVPRGRRRFVSGPSLIDRTCSVNSLQNLGTSNASGPAVCVHLRRTFNFCRRILRYPLRSPSSILSWSSSELHDAMSKSDRGRAQSGSSGHRRTPHSICMAESERERRRLSSLRALFGCLVMGVIAWVLDAGRSSRYARWGYGRRRRGEKRCVISETSVRGEGHF